MSVLRSFVFSSSPVRQADTFAYVVGSLVRFSSLCRMAKNHRRFIYIFLFGRTLCASSLLSCFALSLLSSYFSGTIRSKDFRFAEDCAVISPCRSRRWTFTALFSAVLGLVWKGQPLFMFICPFQINF